MKKNSKKAFLLLSARYVDNGETIRGTFAVDEIRIKPIAYTNRGMLSIFGCDWREIEILKLSRL